MDCKTETDMEQVTKTNGSEIIVEDTPQDKVEDADNKPEFEEEEEGKDDEIKLEIIPLKEVKEVPKRLESFTERFRVECASEPLMVADNEEAEVCQRPAQKENGSATVAKEDGGSEVIRMEKPLSPRVLILDKSVTFQEEVTVVERSPEEKVGSEDRRRSFTARKGSSDVVGGVEKDIQLILEEAQALVEAAPETHPSKLRVAVVGAGPAGLCAARHLLSEGIKAEVFEQCPDIGGTWVYSEEAGNFPLHSSLYHDLWTNLPKESMQFPDFSYKEEGFSYLPSEKILQYLVDYADHFKLHDIIKVRHQVKRIGPVRHGWSVTVEDLARKLEQVSYFDAVMVCSGPNNIPVYPLIEGMAKFSGKQLHSREYRRAQTYSGKRVLVVGLGPSGLDITYQLAPSAKQVLLSHNMTKVQGFTFPEGVLIKPKVTSLNDKTVTFIDDTSEEVDVVIYCTGYTYHFPFLSEECGLIVDQYVSPLYRHLINIPHPTMAIVGLPKYCPHQYMVDYQVRSFMKVLLGRCQLPSKEEMLSDLESDRILRSSEGQRPKDYHKLGRGRTQEYMDELARLGQLQPAPPVLFKLFSDAFIRAIRDFKGFRNYIYTMIDDDSFTVKIREDKLNKTDEITPV